MLAALAVAFVDTASGGSSGIYLASLFDRLGIADRIRSNAMLKLDRLVATRVVSDEADLALHQISEILTVPGARLAGPIPAELQMYTVYAGAIGAAAWDRDAAGAFLRDLTGEVQPHVVKQQGMDIPTDQPSPRTRCLASVE